MLRIISRLKPTKNSVRYLSNKSDTVSKSVSKTNLKTDSSNSKPIHQIRKPIHQIRKPIQQNPWVFVFLLFQWSQGGGVFFQINGNELETAKDDVKEAVKFVDELRISEDGEPYYQGTWVTVVKNSKGKWVEKKQIYFLEK